MRHLVIRPAMATSEFGVHTHDRRYFYARLYLGTPPQKFALIVDTGSTITYVPCSSCGAGCGQNHQVGRVTKAPGPEIVARL